MTTARNEALLHVSGDIVAFVDDDANVHPRWSLGLRDAFSDPSVGAVAGRTLNGHSGEAIDGVDAIGRMLDNGELTGYFAADPGSVIEVDHGIGANMSFRREVLAELGGFRDDFRGVGGVREDTDVFLRVRALGRRVVFAPAATVDHVGAPHVKGRRFDFRYSFWMRHNHALLLARNYGIGSAAFRRWVATELRQTAAAPHPSPAKRLAHASIRLGGLAHGGVAAVVKGGWSPTDPVRRDAVGNAVRRHLGGEEGAEPSP
jgi:GT2 family glycosyltransferase